MRNALGHELKQCDVCLELRFMHPCLQVYYIGGGTGFICATCRNDIEREHAERKEMVNAM